MHPCFNNPIEIISPYLLFKILSPAQTDVNGIHDTGHLYQTSLDPILKNLLAAISMVVATYVLCCFLLYTGGLKRTKGGRAHFVSD